MTIVKSSENLKIVDIYRLTKAPNTKKMSDAKGTHVEIDKWALYEDVDKKTGEIQQILSISTPSGECLATNSPTFINDFVDMVEMFHEAGETVPSIEVISGISKAGREFITCVYG